MFGQILKLANVFDELVHAEKTVEKLNQEINLLRNDPEIESLRYEQQNLSKIFAEKQMELGFLGTVIGTFRREVMLFIDKVPQIEIKNNIIRVFELQEKQANVDTVTIIKLLKDLNDKIPKLNKEIEYLRQNSDIDNLKESIGILRRKISECDVEIKLRQDKMTNMRKCIADVIMSNPGKFDMFMRSFGLMWDGPNIVTKNKEIILSY